MAEKKKNGRALLSSVLSLLLCCAMLIGTTFAWFTDTASTSVNKIQAGTLDIDVQYTLDGEEWADLDGSGDLFEGALWEPGHTRVVALKITNNGNLALKYAVNLNVLNETLGKTAAGQDIKLSDYLEVSTLVSDAMGTSDSLDMDAIMLGNAFASDDGITWGAPAALQSATLGEEYLRENGDVQYFFIKIDMPETVGNEANNDGVNVPSIDLSINVLATQYTYEYDSYTNQYDADAEYPTAVEVSTLDDLRSAIANSDGSMPIKLTGDIELASDDCYKINDTYGYCMLLTKKDVTIDFNGHMFSYTRNTTSGDVATRFGIVAAGGATVNVYDSSAAQTGGISIENDDANDDSWGMVLYAENGSTLNVYGGNFKSSHSEVVYSQGKLPNYQPATINLYGGTYETTSSYSTSLLNIQNGCGSRIHIYGGSYKGFEPGVTNAGEAILASGYKTVENDGWYTVVPVMKTTVIADTTFDMAGQTIALNDVEEAYVMSSDNTGKKITLKNATYTGEAQGIYFGEYTGSSGNYNFNTQADNVTVKDLKVSTSITNGSNKLSAGVWVYGAFELNSCTMSGTTTTQADCTPYDVAFVNHSHGTVNGGKYDSMFVYTMSEVTLKGVEVGKIACMTNTTVGKALTIDKNCVIDTIEFVGSTDYVMNLVIEDGATVNSIVYNGTTYTVDSWNAYIESL